MKQDSLMVSLPLPCMHKHLATSVKQLGAVNWLIEKCVDDSCATSTVRTCTVCCSLQGTTLRGYHLLEKRYATRQKYW